MKMKFYTLGLMLLMAGSTFAQRKNVTPGVVTPGVNAPAIDGVVDASYPAATPIDQSTNESLACRDTANVGPTPNTTAQFRTVADGTNLYVVVEVTDAQVEAGDNVELYFSMLNLLKKNCSVEFVIQYTSHEFQLVVPVLTTDAGATVATSTSTGRANDVSNAFYKKVTGGYVIEMQLPWAELGGRSTTQGFKVEEGRKIGFDVSVNDKDNGARASQLMWNTNGTNYANRHWMESATFGQLTLPAIVLSTSDINNLVSSVSLYPNPSNNGFANLTLEAKTSEKVSVSILNTLSENVYSNNNVNLVQGSTTNVELPTSNLANGVYYVQISNGEAVMTQKLVVSK